MLRDYASESGFSCPTEDATRSGRPRFDVPEEVIRRLNDIHGSWQEVAREASVSYRTILRRRHQYSMPVNDTSGPRVTYSDITNSQLCDAISEVLQIMPNAGETIVIGALRNREIHVQRWRVREAINIVDPVSRALRRCRAVIRRSYNVPCPNALW